MKPIEFYERNSMLLKPKNMTEKQCSSLPVFTDGVVIISCWKMSFIERIKALLFGKIWLRVLSKRTHPPVVLCCEKPVMRF